MLLLGVCRTVIICILVFDEFLSLPSFWLLLLPSIHIAQTVLLFMLSILKLYVNLICFVYSMPFYKIMVPTVDTVRYDFLVYSLLQAKRPVLLTGPVGTGKTSLAQKVLQRLDPKIYSLLVINMSAQVRRRLKLKMSVPCYV